MNTKDSQFDFQNVEGFDWDEGNISKNEEKHGIHWTEIEQVFFNEPIVVNYDEKHSEVEDRWYLLGRTDDNKLLFVVFTIRNNKIRPISARKMSKKEREVYKSFWNEEK